MRRLVLFMIAAFAVMLPQVSWADSQFRLLVVAMPSKYHFEYIPVARDNLDRLARQHSYDMTWTTNGDVLDHDLSGYAVVVLLNTPVEDLTPARRTRFEDYMRGGGNAVVVHRAAIALPAGSWPWYEKLVGRTVGVHPMLQTGVVTVSDKGFPATFALPERWVWSDEFYTTTNPYDIDIHTVLKVDETSYDPIRIWPGQTVAPMGKDHPIAWFHMYEKGRVFVTTLGHNGEDYRDPRYLDHLLGGIYWAATGLGQSQE